MNFISLALQPVTHVYDQFHIDFELAVLQSFTVICFNKKSIFSQIERCRFDILSNRISQ